MPYAANVCNVVAVLHSMSAAILSSSIVSATSGARLLIPCCDVTCMLLWLIFAQDINHSTILLLAGR